MTRPARALALLFPATLIAAAAAAATPAAAADPAGRAVAQCRAEMLEAFPADSIRNHRIGEIAGNSRRTRVTIYVNADRRYTFECVAGRDGVVVASFDPPLRAQLASGGR